MNYRLRLHIIFWIAYILFESYLEFAWISSSYASVPPFDRWLMALYGEATLCIVKIPLSYFIVYLLNNLSVKIKNALVSLSISVIAFAVAIIIYRLLVIYLVLPYMYHEKTGAQFLFTLDRITSSFLDLVFIVGVVVAVKQYRLSQAAKENEKQLVKDKLESELKFLRTQMNPHFLFNTLNNIYALARKRSEDTADVVMRLSKLLRFMLYESGSSTITIAEELRVLNDYLELEKIRYSERLTILFTKSVDNEAQPIAPLILLPFVDNAFKHGASESRFDSFVHINVQLKQGQLVFTVENSKDENGVTEIRENIGLKNVRRQLELMYPEHTLAVENDKNNFKILLTINLLNHATI